MNSDTNMKEDQQLLEFNDIEEYVSVTNLFNS
jgi:hypothetical protein